MKQRNIYQEAYPDTRVPVLLMRQVRRDYDAVLGSRGGKVGAGSAEVKLPTSATDVLSDLIASLPSDVRSRVDEIDINDGECRLTIRVRESVDVGKIASSLEAGGFSVAPPATQLLESSRDEPSMAYQSVLRATWTNDEPSRIASENET